MGKKKSCCSFGLMILFIFFVSSCVDNPAIPPFGLSTIQGMGAQNVSIRLTANPYVVDPNTGEKVTLTAFVCDYTGRGMADIPVKLTIVPQDLIMAPGSLTKSLIRTDSTGYASTVYHPANQIYVAMNAGVHITAEIHREGVPQDIGAATDTTFILFSPGGVAPFPVGPEVPAPTLLSVNPDVFVCPGVGNDCAGVDMLLTGADFNYFSSVIFVNLAGGGELREYFVGDGVFSYLGDTQIRIHNFPGDTAILCGSANTFSVYVSNNPGHGLATSGLSAPIDVEISNDAVPAVFDIDPDTFHVLGSPFRKFVITGENFVCDPLPEIYFATVKIDPGKITCVSPWQIEGLGIPPSPTHEASVIDVRIIFPECVDNREHIVNFTYQFDLPL